MDSYGYAKDKNANANPARYTEKLYIGSNLSNSL